MILALQYYEGDLEKAMLLARLIADLEPRWRQDVLLALVCQPGTPLTADVKDTLRRCETKMPVEYVVSPRGAKGWADGSGQLWTGTMETFTKKSKDGTCNHDSIFTFDGSDGVPLHNNWIDLLMAEHDNTLKSGKMVTGTDPNDGHSPHHINGNMILQLALMDMHPELYETPLGAKQTADIWDCYHRGIFLKHASVSSVICSEWHRYGVTQEIMDLRAKHSVWLHGYKDIALCPMARCRLILRLKRQPTYPDLIRTPSTPGENS